jgi:thiosulfate/3-mercaptopyruvate sulfurtransferase
VVLTPVVDQRWLKEHRREVVLADVRWYSDGRSGREAYEAGHLPGAIFIDLDTQLAGDASAHAGRHPLPEPERFARSMAESGIADGDTVVAYDDAGGVMAARLVWMLRASGHDAALLDGGVSSYEGELERGRVVRDPATFTARPWPIERLASVEEASDRDNLVFDARDRSRYRGEANPLDPRSGHIPGARSLPCRENLTAGGTLMAGDQLRQRFLDAGIEDAGDVIVYCGSGVTACHDLLAIEHVGLGRGRLFVGSWSQYANEPARPAATGDEPG